MERPARRVEPLPPLRRVVQVQGAMSSGRRGAVHTGILAVRRDAREEGQARNHVRRSHILHKLETGVLLLVQEQQQRERLPDLQADIPERRSNALRSARQVDAEEAASRDEHERCDKNEEHNSPRLLQRTYGSTGRVRGIPATDSPRDTRRERSGRREGSPPPPRSEERVRSFPRRGHGHFTGV